MTLRLGTGIHNPVNPADRHLKGNGTLKRSVRPKNRLCDETRRNVIARLVGFKIEKRLGICLGVLFHGAERIGQIAVFPRTGVHVRGEIQLLEHRVNDVPVFIEQKDIVIFPRLLHLVEPRMIGAVKLIVNCPLLRPVILVLLSGGMRVAVSQIIRIDVKGLQPLGLVDRQIPPPRLKIAQRLPHIIAMRHHRQVFGNRVKIVFKRPRPRLSKRQQALLASDQRIGRGLPDDKIPRNPRRKRGQGSD